MVKQICLLLLCGSLLFVNVQSFTLILPKGGDGSPITDFLSKLATPTNDDSAPEQQPSQPAAQQINLMDMLGQLLPMDKPKEESNNTIETTTRENSSRSYDFARGTMVEDHTLMRAMKMPAPVSPPPTPSLNVNVNVHVDGKLQHEILPPAPESRLLETAKIMLFSAMRKPSNDSSDDDEDTDAKNKDASTASNETADSAADSAPEDAANGPIEITMEDLKSKYPKLFTLVPVESSEEQEAAANDAVTPTPVADSTDGQTVEQASTETPTTGELPVNSVSDGSA